MAGLTATVKILDIPEARQVMDRLQHELADWKERALNAEARLRVYASRATQSDASGEVNAPAAIPAEEGKTP